MTGCMITVLYCGHILFFYQTRLGPLSAMLKLQLILAACFCQAQISFTSKFMKYSMWKPVWRHSWYILLPPALMNLKFHLLYYFFFSKLCLNIFTYAFISVSQLKPLSSIGWSSEPLLCPWSVWLQCFKIYSQSAGLLCLPDLVVITAVLCVISIYLNYGPVATSLSILIIPPAPPPPPIAQKLCSVPFCSYIPIVTGFCHDTVLCYGVYWTGSCQFSQTVIKNFKTDERSALEAHFIYSIITAKCIP
jgi:hypothetical protein